MRVRRARTLARIGAALGLMLALAACTKGGQFDPTTMFDNDVFESKKKLPGQREPLFPNGVPGAEAGVPQDLVKGYQPPPDATTQSADTAVPAPAPPPEAEVKPKPQHKPRVARAPAKPRDTHPPTRISRGTSRSAAPPTTGSTSQSVWPSPPTNTVQQNGQSAQSIWPTPPPTAPAQQQRQQGGQSAQSVWPNPPPTGATTQ